jgi:hypothetical protein
MYLARLIQAWYVAGHRDDHNLEGHMEKTLAETVANVGKQLVRKGKILRGKAGATVRQLKKTVATALSTSSWRLKKGVKMAKSAPTSRQVRKVGQAVGTSWAR